jgi:hypothetical protein
VEQHAAGFFFLAAASLAGSPLFLLSRPGGFKESETAETSPEASPEPEPESEPEPEPEPDPLSEPESESESIADLSFSAVFPGVCACV